MHRIYEAANIIEAMLLKGMLEQQGIQAHVDGYYLQGGLGELPMQGTAGISVALEDISRAQALIAEYEADREQTDPPPES